jgi:hypothetical protein
MQRRGLVVDDEPIVYEMIGKVLNSAGMEALILTLQEFLLPLIPTE